MAILPFAEKPSGPVGQSGGWQDVVRRRYQKGSIRKRGKRKPIWELQWWTDYLNPDGTIGRCRESLILGYVSDMNLREARRAAEEQLRPINSGKALPQSTIAFRSFVEQQFATLSFHSLKPSTRKRYRSTLNTHLLPAFGDKRLCDIGTVDIQRFVLVKFDSGSGWEVCNHLRNLMSKIFADAKKFSYFGGDNPAIGVKLPEKVAVHVKRALSPQQVLQLIPELREPLRTMVLVGILAGLRVGEILGLRWQDVDFENKELRIEQSIYRGITGSPKTKGSKRTLPLPEALENALAAHKRHSVRSDEHELVFQTKNGTPCGDTNLLNRYLKPAGRRIGAPWLSWHTLRRTHATLLQLAGGSAKDAQAQLGHSNINTTLGIYTLPIPSHQREAVEKLSRMVTNGDEFGKIAKSENIASQSIQ
jgi:integrase